MTVAPTPVAERKPRGSGTSAAAHHEPIRRLVWLLAAGAVAFLVPFLFADVLEVPRDLYLALHVTAVGALFLGWARWNSVALRALLARNLAWAIGLGLTAGAVLAAIVFTFDATVRPGGLGFAAALLWRGVVYGAADGLLLGALPVLIVFAAFPFERGRAHLARTVGTGALALAAAYALTVVYHLGYSDFRGSKIAAPVRGTAIWTAPTLLTLNPVGAVIAHSGLHVAAVVHAYEGDTFLPPHAATAPTIALRPCVLGGTHAKCGTLSVAENPSDPDGKHISLAVAVVRAKNVRPKPDPLFWFAGWGGAGVSDDAANVISAFESVNENRDLVFVDQRGTGSSKLLCRAPRIASAEDVQPAAITAAARRCAEMIGPNLRYYTSAVAVDDVDRVRQALGYDRINLYGGSYGATTGQIYLLRHGSHVRSAVFDSGSLLDVRIFERGAPNAQRALELLLARCAADFACQVTYPKLPQELAALGRRVAQSPIAIPGTTQTLTPARLASSVDNLIAYSSGKVIAPRVIHLAATGRLDRAIASLPPLEGTQTTELAYKLLIECNEPWASWRPAPSLRLARGTFLEPSVRVSVKETSAACKGFPKADVPASVGERVRSDVPVLFLTGNEDPADPPAGVAHARRELPNSRTIVFPAAGHGQLGLPCAQRLIAAFVSHASAAKLDTTCVETAAAFPFDTRP
jgi:pimeloyl-ACP methyl ester carboxylesterase